MKFDIEGWDDALVAPAFPIGTKPNLHTQDISHGLGGFFLCRSGDMGIPSICSKIATHGEVDPQGGDYYFAYPSEIKK